MKKAFLSLLVLAGLGGFAQAGGSKYIVEPAPAPIDPACYGAGFEFGGFVSGLFPDNDSYDDAVGGGFSLGYFFNENFGLDFSAAWYDTDSTTHNYTLDAVYRFPINCVAPYVMAGGGIHTNSQTEGLFRFGGGVDVRLFERTSIFADGTWNILGGDIEDYATARVGLRFAF